MMLPTLLYYAEDVLRVMCGVKFPTLFSTWDVDQKVYFCCLLTNAPSASWLLCSLATDKLT